MTVEYLLRVMHLEPRGWQRYRTFCDLIVPDHIPLRLTPDLALVTCESCAGRHEEGALRLRQIIEQSALI